MTCQGTGDPSPFGRHVFVVSLQACRSMSYWYPHAQERPMLEPEIRRRAAGRIASRMSLEERSTTGEFIVVDLVFDEGEGPRSALYSLYAPASGPGLEIIVEGELSPKAKIRIIKSDIRELPLNQLEFRSGSASLEYSSPRRLITWSCTGLSAVICRWRCPPHTRVTTAMLRLRWKTVRAVGR